MCIADWGQVLFRMRAEGPAILPAQGIALGTRGIQYRSIGPTAQKFDRMVGPLGRRDEVVGFPRSPQGDALGWENGSPFGAKRAGPSGTRTDQQTLLILVHVLAAQPQPHPLMNNPS